jgi:hypothetical protein
LLNNLKPNAPAAPITSSFMSMPSFRFARGR